MAELNIDDGPFAGRGRFWALVVFGGVAGLGAGLVFSGERIEGERGEADEDGAEEGGSEAVYVESADQLSDEGEQEGIDEDDVEAEGEDDEGERNEQEEGAEEGIQDAEEQGGCKEVFPVIEVDTGEDTGSDHDGECSDEPAMDEPQQGWSEGLFWLIGVHGVLGMKA
jgi:hypothetical protein